MKNIMIPTWYMSGVNEKLFPNSCSGLANETVKGVTLGRSEESVFEKVEIPKSRTLGIS